MRHVATCKSKERELSFQKQFQKIVFFQFSLRSVVYAKCNIDLVNLAPLDVHNIELVTTWQISERSPASFVVLSRSCMAHAPP